MDSVARTHLEDKGCHEERNTPLTNRSSGINDAADASGPPVGRLGLGVAKSALHPAPHVRIHDDDERLVGPVGDWVDMETNVHATEIHTLADCLAGQFDDRPDVFVGVNMTVFYPVMTRQGKKVIRKHRFRGPDVIIVLGARKVPRRRSWVAENEGKYPDVIVEVLSTSTKKNDQVRKKRIYERDFKTHEYYLFDPETEKLDGFRLVDGRYKPIVPDERGHLYCERLGLSLGLIYDERVEGKLARFFKPDGTLVQTGRERAAAEGSRAERAEKKATRAAARIAQAESKAAKERAERKRLEDMLRQLGVDPNRPK